MFRVCCCLLFAICIWCFDLILGGLVVWFRALLVCFVWVWGFGCPLLPMLVLVLRFDTLIVLFVFLF